MIFVKNNSLDAYFNLALEETLLTQCKDDVFMLWRNDNAVIIGNNQNTLSEINISAVNEKNVKVVRRITGGGAVFHDIGNINYTFISAKKEDIFADFGQWTAPIINALQSLSVNAVLQGRNDLCIDGMKFSGNAQCVKNERLLHHGTLLFSANMSNLSDILKVNPKKISSKGIQSVISHVTNISEHLKKSMTTQEFMDYVFNYVQKNVEKAIVVEASQLDEEILQEANKLKEEKYSTWEWNFGNSPKYTYKQEGYFKAGHIEIQLNVENGIIKNAEIFGDFFTLYGVDELKERLRNVRHRREDITHALSDIDIDKYIKNGNLEEIIELMF